MSVYRHAHLKQTVNCLLWQWMVKRTAEVDSRSWQVSLKPQAILCLFLLMHRHVVWERSVLLLFTNLAVQFICTKLQTVNNVLVASSLSTVSQPPINTRKTHSKQGVVTLTNTVCVYNDDPIYPKYRCGLRQWLYTSEVTSAGPITGKKKSVHDLSIPGRFPKTSSHMNTKKYKT